jgi:hypothetical protein
MAFIVQTDAQAVSAIVAGYANKAYLPLFIGLWILSITSLSAAG